MTGGVVPLPEGTHVMAASASEAEEPAEVARVDAWTKSLLVSFAAAPASEVSAVASLADVEEVSQLDDAASLSLTAEMLEAAEFAAATAEMQAGSEGTDAAFRSFMALAAPL